MKEHGLYSETTSHAKETRPGPYSETTSHIKEPMGCNMRPPHMLKGHAQVYNHKKIGDFILAYYYDHMM